METPNETLAKRIAAQLVQGGLVDASRQWELTARLATGRLTAEDWKVVLQRREDAEANRDAE